MFKKEYSIHNKVNKGYLIESEQILLQSNSVLIKIDVPSRQVLVETSLTNGPNIQKIEKSKTDYIGLASGKICFFDDDLKLKSEKSIRYSGYHLYGGKYIVKVIDYDYNTFEGRYGLYDLISDEMVWEASSGENLRIDEEMAFTASPKEIGKRNITTGNNEWKYEIDNKSFVPEIIGVFKDMVLFGLQNKDKLIALDLATGELKWDRTTINSIL